MSALFAGAGPTGAMSALFAGAPAGGWSVSAPFVDARPAGVR